MSPYYASLNNCQNFVILRATNTVHLTSSSVSSTYGDTVNFTGLIQTNGVTAEDAAGDLIFAVDGAMVATNALTNGVATYSTSGLTATGHSITVTYSGDNNYTNNTTGILAQNVTPASLVFSGLTASQSVIYKTLAVTLSGTLLASSGVKPPQGETVTVTINSNQISTTIIDGGGNFSLSFPSATLSVNGSPYSINFAYAGDGNLAATNDSSTSLTVNPASATVSLDDLNHIFNGYAESVTANTVPTNLLVVISYNGSSSAPTNAGSYTVVGAISDPNYQGVNGG